jgi:hypothetical protein
VDDDAKMVFVIQGKYRKQIGTKAEARNDVLEFARLGPLLAASQTEFQAHARTLAPVAQQRLAAARSRVRNRHYGVWLYYVTAGRCSANIIEDARRASRSGEVNVSLSVVTGRQVLLLLADYLDGVAPPVPSLDLEIDGNILQRYDKHTDIESWIFSMSDHSVAEMHERAGTRLFARNVRGFLGNTEINQNMEATLLREPEFFWYYNNGITIVCDHAERIGSHGRDVVRVTNPQVINGQQTTRTLARAKARKASVLVRVIRVPRGHNGQPDHFETLVSRIVAATNSQNAVKASDLMANDRRQIEIERQFRKLGYGYIRKRQTKSEARRTLGAFRIIVKKDELAQAVAACELDPQILREGKERLFEKRLYTQVFPNADPYYYLTRYWLMRQVGYAARGYPERAYAKWLVLNAVWPRFSGLVQSRASKETFKRIWEHDEGPLRPLQQANDAVFRAALQFYRSKRGKGAKAQDISTFFKRRRLQRDFGRFWGGARNSHRGRFQKAWRRFERRFKESVQR